MMAGCVYLVVSSTGFWLGFIVGEFITWLSSIGMEGFMMLKKVFNEMLAFVERCSRCAILSLEAHLPSRLSLLTGLCEPSEKGTESAVC
jgi:hypothetical protein